MSLPAHDFPPRRLWRERRSTVAVLFACMAVPVAGLVGLAVDYGIWNETYATLALADNVAALNAVKTAAAANINGKLDYIAEGVNAGKQWFAVSLGQGNSDTSLSTLTPTVSVSLVGRTITATVTYNGTIKSVFGNLFKQAIYPVNVTSTASMLTAPYLEVQILMDNSASMGIGASLADQTKLMQNTACDPSNEYTTTGNGVYSSPSSDGYGIYQYSYDGNNYHGGIATPVTDAVSGITLKPANNYMIPYCSTAYQSQGKCPQVEQCGTTGTKKYAAYAGPPCAFACHFDGNSQAGLGNDTWALARRLGVVLRADLVKNATRQVINAMQTYNVPSMNNLSVGVFTFTNILNPIYPGTGCTQKAFGCEAGSDWTTALNDVGSPPTPNSGIYVDSGIQPVLSQTLGNNDNTAVVESINEMTTNWITPAGDGSTATSPIKVVFLITDGVQDSPYSQIRSALPYTACNQFKNMGYSVYVVYTPYNPLMHQYYLDNMISYVEGTGTDSITYNLQKCSSATNANNLSNYYITATDQASLSAALTGFLKNALQSAVKYTQ